MVRHLIALDFDGTCARYEPELGYDEPLLDLLRETLGNEVQWVMNTDRPFHQMRDVSLALPPELRPRALLLRQRDMYELGSHAYLPHEDWNSARDADHQTLWEQLAARVPSWSAQIEETYEVLERYVDEKSFAYMVPPEQMPALRSYVTDLVSPWPDAQVSGNADWCFVLHSSFSKARVLRAYADHHGIAPEHIIAVGDGLNDLTMLDGSVTPRVGCPSNACEEVQATVRAAGGVRADQPDAAGTAQVLRHYLGKG